MARVLLYQVLAILFKKKDKKSNPLRIYWAPWAVIASEKSKWGTFEHFRILHRFISGRRAERFVRKPKRHRPRSHTHPTRHEAFIQGHNSLKIVLYFLIKTGIFRIARFFCLFRKNRRLPIKSRTIKGAWPYIRPWHSFPLRSIGGYNI